MVGTEPPPFESSVSGSPDAVSPCESSVSGSPDAVLLGFGASSLGAASIGEGLGGGSAGGLDGEGLGGGSAGGLDGLTVVNFSVENKKLKQDYSCTPCKS